jgi:hypothetical protein
VNEQNNHMPQQCLRFLEWLASQFIFQISSNVDQYLDCYLTIAGVVSASSLSERNREHVLSDPILPNFFNNLGLNKLSFLVQARGNCADV